MARIPLIEDRDGLTLAQQSVYDQISASRGSLIRPYQLLIHAPDVAGPMSELGAQLRYHSSLSDHDRELVIMTVAASTGCAFEWDSHEGIAREAGVRPEVLDHLADDAPCELTAGERSLISFVRELHAGAGVERRTFDAVSENFDHVAMVELASIVGYYTMLAYVMGAFGAC